MAQVKYKWWALKSAEHVNYSCSLCCYWLRLSKTVDF